MSDARSYWNLCVFESEVLEWITELNVLKDGNYSSYLPENVDKFSLGSRMCVLLSESRTLEKDGEKMDIRNVGEGEMSSRILPDNAEECNRMLLRSRLDRSFRTHLMILDVHIVIFRPIVLDYRLPLFELSNYWRANGSDWFYISSNTRTWCLYGRALSLKYRCFWLVNHLECKCERVHATDAAEGTWLATETMVFLTLLRTQLILGGDAMDTKCLPIERCWTETFLSQILRNDFRCTSSGLGFVFRHQQDSARKMLILSQDMT